MLKSFKADEYLFTACYQAMLLQVNKYECEEISHLVIFCEKKHKPFLWSPLQMLTKKSGIQRFRIYRENKTIIIYVYLKNETNKDLVVLETKSKKIWFKYTVINISVRVIVLWARLPRRISKSLFHGGEQHRETEKKAQPNRL